MLLNILYSSWISLSLMTFLILFSDYNVLLICFLEEKNYELKLYWHLWFLLRSLYLCKIIFLKLQLKNENKMFVYLEKFKMNLINFLLLLCYFFNSKSMSFYHCLSSFCLNLKKVQFCFLNWSNQNKNK